jgi:hypothetical protein
MPKIIVANVDSDAMCGTDMPPDIHALSSLCCCRLLVLAEDEDLVVLPHAVSEEFVSYVNGLLGRNLSEKNVILPRNSETEQLILNFDSLNDGWVEEQIRQRVGSVRGWTLEAYFLDRAALTLARSLELDVSRVEPGFLEAGGAETYNSKVLFRQLAEVCGTPVAEGRIATTAAELARAVGDLVARNGRVMVKQDTNSGGAGNVAVTVHGETELTGASRVVPVEPGFDPEALAASLWPQIAVQRNTRVVVEVYHPSVMVHYSELWVSGDVDAPTVLNFGEMRMEPTFIGLEIPPRRLSEFQLAEMIAHSTTLAAAAGRRGFRGYMNIDSILTEDGELLFTEVNGRMGDCTHIDYLARRLVGDSYGTEHTVLTRNWVPVRGFTEVVGALRDEGLLYDHSRGCGVVLPIEDVDRSGVIDYMVIGDDARHARRIEEHAERVLSVLGG